MTVTIYMTTSVNGLAATVDHSEDFLSDENWLEFVRLAKELGCVVYGRTTHELLKAWPPHYLNDLQGLDVIVLTSRPQLIGSPFLAASNPTQACDLAQSRGHQQLLVAGGPVTNTAFLRDNLANRLVLNLEPTLLGQGLSFLAPFSGEQRLVFQHSQLVTPNIIQLQYLICSEA